MEPGAVTQPEPCPRCGGDMHPATVRTAIWREERVFVVEDIPAQVCASCMEQFYDEEVTDTLRRLTEENFASAEPAREIVVQVYSLKDQVRRRDFAEDEAPVDY